MAAGGHRSHPGHSAGSWRSEQSRASLHTTMDTLDLMDTTAEMEIATESSRDIFNTDTGEIDKISTSGCM